MQCMGDRSRIDGRSEYRCRLGNVQDKQNLGGEAFVGELDAPEIAGGVENLDAQFKAAVEFAGADSNDAEFLGFL